MSTHEATSQQPLLQAIDLKKHYPVKKGIFAGTSGEGAGWRFV